MRNISEFIETYRMTWSKYKRFNLEDNIPKLYLDSINPPRFSLQKVGRIARYNNFTFLDRIIKY